VRAAALCQNAVGPPTLAWVGRPQRHAARESFIVQPLPSVTAATVCEVRRRLAGAYPGPPLTLVVDKARYQRCALVQERAGRLGRELLFWPPSAPHLNLIARVWQLVKNQGLSGQYYPESAAFQPALLDGSAQAGTQHKAALESLLTWRFPTCTAVPIVGDKPQVAPFPVTKRKRTATQKVSTKAA